MHVFGLSVSQVFFGEPGKAEFLLWTTLRKNWTFTPHLTFDLDPRPLPQNRVKDNKMSCLNTLSQFDLDLWPTTLTYNPSLVNVQVDLYVKNQGERSNGSTARWMDGCYWTYYLRCFAVDNEVTWCCCYPNRLSFETFSDHVTFDLDPYMMWPLGHMFIKAGEKWIFM